MPESSQPLELTPHGEPGLLITFCGIDGSGKTSMIDATSDYLERVGFSCFKTYTPTQRIRKNPLFRELSDSVDANAWATIDILGMSLSILGDFLQHIKDTIAPHLARGHAVICDRYVYSSLGEIRVRTQDPEVEDIFATIVRRMPCPDLAIAMDITPEIAERRIREREAECDKPLDLGFMALRARHYLDVARENRLLVVSSNCRPEETFQTIRLRLDQCVHARSGCSGVDSRIR